MTTYNHKNTEAVLKEIENNLPSELRERLMKTVINTDQEESAREMLKTDLSPDVRKMLEEDLKNGEFRFEEEIADEEITKQIDEYYDSAIKLAIKEGRLDHPDKDPFFNARMDKLEKKND